MTTTPSDHVATTVMSTLAAAHDEMLTIAQKMHWVTSVIVGTFFVVIGLVGNSLSILVWNRKSLRSSTGIYLIAQAVADIGVLVFFFVTDSIVMMEPSIKIPYSYGVFFSYIGYPFFFLFVICSIWITVGVTVDRYIQVCWIGHSKAMCSHRRALFGIGIIVLLCFIINLPHFWTFRAVPVEDRANPDDPGFTKAEFGKTGGSDDYEFWVHCMFLVLAPWVTIFTLNMLIIREVSLANKKMDKARGEEMKEKSKKKEAQITRLLLTVTFSFLILIALQCITQCFFMMKPNGVDPGKEFQGVVSTTMKTHNVDIRRGHTAIHRDQAIVERFNRTLAERLFGYQYAKEFIQKKRSREWVKRLPSVVSALNNEITRTINMKPRIAITKKYISDYVKKDKFKELPILTNVIVRYLYEPGELEGGTRRATDPIWSVTTHKISTITRSENGISRPAIYRLDSTAPQRGFTREQLQVIPEDTQLPPKNLN